MNASSGQNLSAVLLANVERERRALNRRRTRGVTDRAQLCRTNVTCIWGVSDPRNLGAGP